MKPNNIIAVERVVGGNIKSEGAFDAQPQTEGLAVSSAKDIPDFLPVGSQGTVPENKFDSEVGSSKKALEGMDRGKSPPSTREIKSREKMAPKAEWDEFRGQKIKLPTEI